MMVPSTLYIWSMPAELAVSIRKDICVITQIFGFLAKEFLHFPDCALTLARASFMI